MSSDKIKMEDNYKPTRREVFGEMWGGIKDTFSRERLPKAGQHLKEFFSYAFGTEGILLVAPYIIPTFIRGTKECGEPSTKSKSENAGLWTGFISGIAIDMVQATGYVYLAEHNHPEALLIPAATNLIFGAYEIGRIPYKGAEKRLIERKRQSSQRLEEVAESDSQPEV